MPHALALVKVPVIYYEPIVKYEIWISHHKYGILMIVNSLTQNLAFEWVLLRVTLISEMK